MKVIIKESEVRNVDIVKEYLMKLLLPITGNLEIEVIKDKEEEYEN